MRRRALGPLAALSLAVWACGDGDQVGPPPPPPPPPAEPGPVDFDVTTSADVDDGALLLTVLGGPVDSVRGLAGYDVLDAPTATGAKAIVYGAIVDGALLRVWVPNASGTIPAATAAADPLDEPPGVWSSACGLRVGPGAK